MPEALWMKVHNTLYETLTKTVAKKKKYKKVKLLSEKSLKIGEERRVVIVKGERERHTQLNTEFQRRARRDKKASLSEHCK